MTVTKLPPEMVRKMCLHNVKYLTDFVAAFSGKYPGIGFERHVKNLHGLEQVLLSDPPKISKEHLRQLESLARDLTVNNHFVGRYFVEIDAKQKLKPFWHMCRSVMNSLDDIVDIILFLYDEQRPPSESLDKTAAYALKLAKTRTTLESTEDALLDNPESKLAIQGALTAIESRVDAHENMMARIIAKAKEKSTLNYDVEDLCSVNEKIQQGTIWKSDVRAIRDAYSHNEYTITKMGSDVEIEFHNCQKGYNFKRKYTRVQFLKLYQNFARFIIIQAILVRLAFLYSLLKENSAV